MLKLTRIKNVYGDYVEWFICKLTYFAWLKQNNSHTFEIIMYESAIGRVMTLFSYKILIQFAIILLHSLQSTNIRQSNSIGNSSDITKWFVYKSTCSLQRSNTIFEQQIYFWGINSYLRQYLFKRWPFSTLNTESCFKCHSSA